MDQNSVEERLRLRSCVIDSVCVRWGCVTGGSDDSDVVTAHGDGHLPVRQSSL